MRIMIELVCWIYEHFPSEHDCVTDDGYDKTSPHACRWLTMKGLTASPYRTRIDALTITDMCWMPYGDHRGVRAFDLISCFLGQLRWGPIVVTLRPERVVRQFSYVQTIPPPPISATLSYDDIDNRWIHYSNHLAIAGQICLVPGQVSGDYMEWFFLISHPFITPTQAGDQPRHPLVPQHEAYVELDILEVPMAVEGGPSQAPDPPDMQW